jgi:hypothetical protein
MASSTSALQQESGGRSRQHNRDHRPHLGNAHYKCSTFCRDQYIAYVPRTSVIFSSASALSV